ncbi:unnamed protein product [Nezara viridula]|uniref:ATP synthase mitochondrial F1 complex assembly factor 2 n=1 Tax=Nezara viridula TaxID=85310 RepID=A0A9P0DWS8_NEZVI|nr:unnamed protein product [Nezara viridula]
MFYFKNFFLRSQNILLNSSKFNIIPKIKRNYAALPKRFYKNTAILYSDGHYEITLDHRKLKTPKGKDFKVENEILALCIATEWDSQFGEIDRSSMHLTALCNTAIDNVNNLTKEDITSNILNYLETDTLLFQSHNDEVYDVQQKEWQPVIKWFCDRYGVEISPTRDMIGPEISKQTREIIERHFLSYDLAPLHGFMFAVEALKSVILTLCCVDRRLSVDQVVLLSRLEEEYQTGCWGRVEWAHDVSQYDLQARVSAAVLFIHLNSMSEEVKSKLGSVHR